MKPAMEIGRGGSLQRRPTGRNQRGGVEGVYDGDPHCDLHGHVPPKVSTASASSGPEGKSADSQPIPRVLIHSGKSANYRTRVSSSSPGTLQVPLTGCTNRAISRTVRTGQKQLRKLRCPVLSKLNAADAKERPCCRHRLSTGEVMCKKANHAHHRPHSRAVDRCQCTTVALTM